MISKLQLRTKATLVLWLCILVIATMSIKCLLNGHPYWLLICCLKDSKWLQISSYLSKPTSPYPFSLSEREKITHYFIFIFFSFHTLCSIAIKKYFLLYFFIVIIFSSTMKQIEGCSLREQRFEKDFIIFNLTRQQWMCVNWRLPFAHLCILTFLPLHAKIRWSMCFCLI